MLQARRPLLDAEENSLHDQLLEMGALTRRSILGAFTALEQLDRPAAAQLIKGDLRVNALLRDVERQCLAALASQQPVAGDLRHILAALHIAQELERIADYGADIAKIVLELDMQPLADELQPLEQMVSDCTEMLQQVLDAYHAGDQVAARAAAARDSALDALESGVVAHIMERMSSTPKSISRCTRLLWIGHHLERIGDRVTNIAERVVFMITGETPDLDRRH